MGDLLDSGDEPYVAHGFSSQHRERVMASERCGCFYCRQLFSPAEIEEWTDDGETALCPRCGIDSVLPSTGPYTLSPEFLDRMHRLWFSVG